MKRSAVTLAGVADWHNLNAAFHQASRGKAARTDVAGFGASLERELATLRRDILDGSVRLGEMRAFRPFCDEIARGRRCGITPCSDLT